MRGHGGWLEHRGLYCRSDYVDGFSADDIVQMLNEHEAALTAGGVILPLLPSDALLDVLARYVPYGFNMVERRERVRETYCDLLEAAVKGTNRKDEQC